MRKLLIVLLASLLMAAVVSAQTGDTTYTVQSGDTITGIAAAFDVDANDILIANNLIDPNRIRRGQQLVIPTGPVTTPASHVVQRGERLNDIALRYGTTTENLAQLNTLANTDSILPGQVIQLPGTRGGATFERTYIVDIGDTLRSIGAQFGVTWQALAAYNNIPYPNYIQAGMMLRIPPVGYVPQQPPTSPPPPPPQPDPHPIIYVVQVGDYLGQIAVHYGTTVAAIRQLNHLHPSDPIFPGQVLYIPARGIVHPPIYVPRQTINGYYHVRAGDTLFAIAHSFQVNIYDIAEANGILNLNSIFAGQALHIPGY